MIKIAVTGGIGSGKSYISHLLEDMHIPVYNADNEAKRLTVSDAGIRGELIALLGEEVYKDGLLNKPLLASYLFSDPAHVLQINSIIHPRVRKDFTVWWNVRKSVRWWVWNRLFCMRPVFRIRRCGNNGLCTCRTAYTACHVS